MRAVIALLLWLVTLPAFASNVHQLTIDGPIGPASADYVVEGLEQAANEQAAAVILRLDTPGGLDQAMRDIVQAILASPIPVVSYVSPSGARAASAGTYILYASHVAAMAPGTNLGAATPVKVGGGLPGQPGSDSTPESDPQSNDEAGSAAAEKSASERKMINDAVAYIRSLAELRARNADWAERAVRESVSLSAESAREQEVIDLVAASTPALLEQLASRLSGVDAQTTIADRPPDWRHELLATITNPNVAYILLLVGMYGLIFELANPGALVPGVIGGISLLLALFALQALPINIAGLGLVALGILFMLTEALVPSFGALGVGGVLAFGLGSLLLFDTEGPGFELSMLLVAGVSAASLVIFLGTATLALRAFQRRGVAGLAHMQGAEGEVIRTDPDLRVRVEGEDWHATAQSPLAPGDRVTITDIDGLTLKVKPHTGEQT